MPNNGTSMKEISIGQFLPGKSTLLVIALCQFPGFACECAAPRNIYERKSSSDLAFEGKVVLVRVDSVAGIYETRFAVSKILLNKKMEQAKWISIQTSIWGVACGTQFPTNERVLVFARKLKNGKVFESSACDQNVINPTKLQIDSLYDGKMVLPVNTKEPQWKKDFLKRISE
jgi:hypothetical protein